jgi:hypothetical protein
MPKRAARPQTEVQQFDDSQEWVIPIPGEPRGTILAVQPGRGDGATIAKAFENSLGVDAIVQRLVAIDVKQLLGSEAMPSEVVIRPPDARMIADALKHKYSPAVLTLILAEAIIHAMVEREGKHQKWESRERLSQATQKASRKATQKYHRCSEAKKEKSGALEKAIRFALETGTPREPAAILKALSQRDDADYLLFRGEKEKRKMLSRKTIANWLSKIT